MGQPNWLLNIDSSLDMPKLCILTLPKNQPLDPRKCLQDSITFRIISLYIFQKYGILNKILNK